MGAFLLIPALICFAVTMLIGIALSLTGFLLSGKMGILKRSSQIWLITVTSVVLILMPLFCSLADEPQGGPPTSESYGQMMETMAVWSILPGVALTAGGIAQIVLLIRRRKQTLVRV